MIKSLDNIKKNQVIYSENEKNDNIYFIKQGSFQVNIYFIFIIILFISINFSRERNYRRVS